MLNHHAVKMYEGVEVKFHPFLTSAQDVSGHLHAWARGTHWVKGWVESRGSLDKMVKRKKNPYPCWELNPDHLVHSHLLF
jgi:hypothetical protein